MAIRLWMDSATPFNSPDAGGLHSPPVLGNAQDIEGQVRLDFDDIAHRAGSGFLESLILIMAMIMAGALYWLDPQEDAYFWLALVCLVTLLGNSIVQLASFTTPMGQTEGVILHDVVSTPIRIGLWVMFWAYWFRVPRLRLDSLDCVDVLLDCWRSAQRCSGHHCTGRRFLCRQRASSFRRSRSSSLGWVFCCS